jgi:ATP-dependent DNA ligase
VIQEIRLEKQFYLPAVLVDRGHRRGRQVEQVGEEDQDLLLVFELKLDGYRAQGLRDAKGVRLLS